MLYTIKEGTRDPQQTANFKPWYSGQTFLKTKIAAEHLYQSTVSQYELDLIGDRSRLYGVANVVCGISFQAATMFSFNDLTVRYLPNGNDLNIYGAIKHSSKEEQMFYIGRLNYRERNHLDIEFTDLGYTFQILIYKNDGYNQRQYFGKTTFSKKSRSGWLKYGILPRFNDLSNGAPKDIPFDITTI